MPATTLTDRAVIRLSGEDVRGFLQGLVTNEVSSALPVWAALLSAQGKCLFDFLVWADGGDLLIDCEADAAEELAKRVVIVDTSNEIAGDGDIPHPALGRARRMQVPEPALQHAVMIEAVENHMPEVIVIDEIGTEQEAFAARTGADELMVASQIHDHDARLRSYELTVATPVAAVS